MGTFYTLGIINKFGAQATKGPTRWNRENLALTEAEWKEALDKRIDTSIFDLELQEDGTIKGFLKNNVFKENIKGFYEFLREILGEHRNGNFDYYEKGMSEDGELHDINVEDDDDGYSYEWANDIRILNKDGVEIRIECEFIMLFLEGKVLVEEFYTDPVLINYLFRNSKIDNPLAGAVISAVVG
ncbi:hypothetical protein SAMN05444673_2819 [Bacillus sp. OV166]|uniref:hypothetical protein n=1 Tax=Bacillus sp. OV166 TaxID=1882763 RepID=UPI000A2AD971|nr:hypothetical protein [Bacillus sp. OV166]SMQ77491.1 hypothetical protein SAMN05444673_2819 [Bacillus sp. OV166]